MQTSAGEPPISSLLRSARTDWCRKNHPCFDAPSLDILNSASLFLSSHSLVVVSLQYNKQNTQKLEKPLRSQYYGKIKQPCANDMGSIYLGSATCGQWAVTNHWKVQPVNKYMFPIKKIIMTKCESDIFWGILNITLPTLQATVFTHHVISSGDGMELVETKYDFKKKGTRDLLHTCCFLKKTAVIHCFVYVLCWIE